MLNFILTLIYKYNKIKRGEYPLSILYYHHVFSTKNTYHPDDLCAKEFELQINFLKKHFNILPIEQAISLLQKKQLPPKALVISFDDGYQDNYTIAAPILEKNNCPAIFFIATQGVENGYLWNDIIEQAIKKTTVKKISNEIIGTSFVIETQKEKTNAFHELVSHLKFKNTQERSKQIKLLCEELNTNNFSQTMMNNEQIASLHSKGFAIGAHTHSHTILTTETIETCSDELSVNKACLEKITQEPVNFLAYPNGLYTRDFTQEHCNLSIKLNFKAAFSTNDGGAIHTINKHSIPRFMPYRKQLSLFALSIAKIAGEHA